MLSVGIDVSKEKSMVCIMKPMGEIVAGPVSYTHLDVYKRQFEFFTPERKFNTKSFSEKVNSLLSVQESLVIIINTPAHNPTGYSLTLEDWDSVIEVLTEAAACGKAIALVIDAAYIDFAGDEEEYRRFLPKLEKLPENVISIMAYSLSKTYTLYGTRCGAKMCIRDRS